jgi:A/G-specific adenine glycosylase
MPMSAKEDLSQTLLRWFDASRRELPWRRRGDAYAIWVSEVMLQQTQVENVTPYFERFLQRFPTVEDLARAEGEEVLATWSGLGYYARARRLHQAARQIQDEGGQLPATVEGWRSLPGVGPYTAAAVASIAFGVVEPAIDGNAERVLCRVLALPGDTRRAAARRRLKETARRLLDPERPGDSNQALMELGATVCRPQRPECSRCPLRLACRAAALGRPEGFPAARSRQRTVRVSRHVIVVRDGGHLLLFRRPEDSRRLAGMWELPWAEGDGGGSLEERLAERYGGKWRVGPSRGRIRHSITDHRFEIDVRAGELDGGREIGEGPTAGWFQRAQIGALPVSSLVGKVLARLENGG